MLAVYYILNRLLMCFLLQVLHLGLTRFVGVAPGGGSS